MHALDHRGFFRVVSRYEYLGQPRFFRGDDHAEHAVDGAYVARKRQLAYETALVKLRHRVYYFGGGEYRRGYRGVVRRAFFFSVCRREIYRQPLLRKQKSRVRYGGVDPLF